MKKRFFPGTSTLAERKRFAVFHACTLLISPVIGAFLIILLYLSGSRGFSGSLSLNPFSHVRDWLIWSLFAWNFIGSIRFHDDAFTGAGICASRLVVFFCSFFFPLIYLYNLWCIIIKKGCEKKAEENMMQL